MDQSNQQLNWTLTATQTVTPATDAITASAQRMATGMGTGSAAAQRLQAQIAALEAQQRAAIGVIDAYNAATEAGTFGTGGASVGQAINALGDIEPKLQRLQERLAGMQTSATGAAASLGQVGTAGGAAASAATPPIVALGEGEGQLVGRSREAGNAVNAFVESVGQLAGRSRDTVGALQGTATAIDGVGAAARSTHPAVIDTGNAADKSGNAFSGFLKKLGNMAEYMLIWQGLSLVQQGLSAIATTAVTVASDTERYIAVLTQFVGATTAASRAQDTLREATRTGIPLTDLEALDQRLAELKITAQTAPEQFGRSIGQLRKDMEDLASAPGMDMAQVTTLFTRGEEGAQRFADTIKRLGLASVQEMKDAGVQYDATGKTIVSDSNTVVNALLNITESKLGGLSDRLSNTWGGLTTRLKNTWDEFIGALGEGALPELEPVVAQLVTDLSSPGMVTTLREVGSALGTMAADFLLLNEYGLRFISMFTDTSSIQKGIDDAAAAAAAARAKYGTKGEGEDPVQRTTRFVGQLQNQLQGVQDQQTALNAQYQAGEEAIRASITAVRDRQVAVDAQYQAGADALRQQVTALDQAYQLQRQIYDLNKIDKDIAVAKAEAVNVYSSSGRAAAVRLVTDEEQRGQLVLTMAHDKTKNAIESKVAALDAERKAADASFAAQTKGLETRLKAMQDAAADSTKQAQGEERAIQEQIKAIQAAAKAEQDRFTQYPTLADGAAKAQTGLNGSAQAGISPFHLLQVEIGILLGKLGLTKTALDEVKISWDLLAGAWNTGKALVLEFAVNTERVANAWGINQGVAWGVDLAKHALDGFVTGIASGSNVVLTALGSTIRQLADAFAVAARGAMVAGDFVMGHRDQMPADIIELQKAINVMGGDATSAGNALGTAITKATPAAPAPPSPHMQPGGRFGPVPLNPALPFSGSGFLQGLSAGNGGGIGGSVPVDLRITLKNDKTNETHYFQQLIHDNRGFITAEIAADVRARR